MGQNMLPSVFIFTSHAGPFFAMFHCFTLHDVLFPRSQNTSGSIVKDLTNKDSVMMLDDGYKTIMMLGINLITITAIKSHPFNLIMRLLTFYSSTIEERAVGCWG